MFRLAPAQPNHEELFIQRYALLLASARKLTNGDQQRAEDLVHDVFVQFTLARPDLGVIENIDGYLYRMLRNRHLSNLRRNARTPLDRPASVDYDSAQAGLRAADPRDRLQALDELRTICRYACARKETSKAGSILILRFFHGYYPSEITQLSISSRSAVDTWLRIARGEARIYLQDPARLAFLKGTVPNEVLAACNNDNLLHEIQATIFGSRTGDCLPQDRLRIIYAEDEAIGSTVLAHLVSCAACLDHANDLLGLPLLADRCPTDMIGRDRGPRDGPGGPGGAASNLIKQSRLRSREVYEQSPTKLSIAVNGFTVGTQSVCSDLNQMTLNVNIDEKIGFVEVFSDQDTLLLTMDVEPPPDGPIKQSAKIDLSDDRSLELALSFVATWPSLQVTYRDPALKTPAVSAAIADNTPEFLASSARPPVAPQPASWQPEARLPRENALTRLLGLIPGGFWLRPATITAILAVILAVALLLVRLPVPAASAAELLGKAAESERVLAARPDTAVHRIVTLEERDPNANRLISRSKIELWRSSSPIAGRRAARRVYDEQGRIIAGEFIDQSGASQIYRSGGGLPDRSASQALQLAGREIWQIDPSAAEFASLIVDPMRAKVTDDSDGYHITFDNHPASNLPELVRAALTLSKPGLHVTQEALQVKHDGAVLEYRFVEDTFEEVKPAVLPSAVFNAEPPLARAESGLLKPGLNIKPETGAGEIPPRPVVASADLEVEVQYLLDHVRANLGEQVAVSRTPDGNLLVKGIVDTESRKSEILAALSSVSHNPAVRIDISTVAEMGRRQKQPSNASVVQRLDINSDSRIPVYGELRRHFLGAGVAEDQVDDQISRFSARVLRESGEALRNAWALRTLAGQISLPGQELSQQSRAKQLAMIRDHARACLAAYSQLSRDLQPIFRSSESSGAPSGPSSVNSEPDLRGALKLLATQAAVADAAIRSAFTIKPGSAESHAADRFWRPLIEAEATASSVARFPRE